MSKQFTIRDFHELTQAERDVMLDRLFDDLQKPQPPLVRTGQGDFMQDYEPEPRAAIDWRTAVMGGLMIVAASVLMFLVASVCL